uniref:DUF868 domain-containing protein n=1 Tax=Glycine max TaxID=3847 RepID=K7KIG1_SOYBN
MSSSPFPSCFRPSPNAESHPPPPPPPHSTISNLTIYHTDTGPVSLTWSRSIVGRSLHIQLHQNPLDSPPYPNPNPNPSPSTTLSFHLHIRPFLFWKKHGSKKLAPNTHLFWNLSRAKFGATPEPLSGFYVALVVHNHMTLLIGDAARDAFSKSKARHPNTPQLLLLKKERVFADRLYTTRARFGGKAPLKWKFRGNERVQVDGVHVQISWDLYNWLFDKNNNSSSGADAHAIFMFKFEEDEVEAVGGDRNNLVALWNLGASEWGKTWSSSSLSSSGGSFGGSSSVLEWSSVEENELVVPVGFSLLVYAWKR